MCGRFSLDDKSTDLAGFFEAEDNFPNWMPAFSIAPTDHVPVIRERQDKHSGEITRRLDEAVWDFHPTFMKGSKRPQFNARIETVATNGLWKGAFASSRCIVPMRGYFEWTERTVDGKKLKVPHFIHGPDDLLAAAGIFAARKVGEEWEVSTAIITREARDASGELHDRMPAFLEPEVFDCWLEPGKWDDAQKIDALAMLTRVSEKVASTMTTYEVDRKVNNSRTADPLDASLIQPVAG
jgi:putative SOS response-associated peptidase YedK